MDFEDFFLATGIGSFPHEREEDVFPLVIQNFSQIPCWPQLPKRSFLEGMLLQYSEGFPGLKWDDKGGKVWVDLSDGFEREVEKFYGWLEADNLEPFEITDNYAKGLRILETLASGEHRKTIRYMKGQVTGPVTFGLSLADPDQKPIFYDPTLREILVKHLSAKACWMERKFSSLLPEAKTIIFFDEPSLSSFGSAFSGLNREEVISSLNGCFHGIKGLKGVHCCGNTDWSLLFSTDLDILSFDAFDYFETLSLYPGPLKAFLERGGILAWGIVPTSDAIRKEDEESLVKRLKEGVRTLTQKGIDPALLRRAILTPSCGTASLPVPLAERVCRVTSGVSKRLREDMAGTME